MSRYRLNGFGIPSPMSTSTLPLPRELEGLQPAHQIMVIFYLRRSKDQAWRQHPYGDKSQPLRGVFTLKSPHRPDPIGVTVVDLLGVDGNAFRAKGLDAINRTPVLDLRLTMSGKPVIRDYERWYGAEGQTANDAECELPRPTLLASEPFWRSAPAPVILRVGCTSQPAGNWPRQFRGDADGSEQARRGTACESRRQCFPFAGSAVDVGVLIATLEFLGDPITAVREAARVARRGLAPGVLNAWHPWTWR